MIELNKIYNEDCMDTMARMDDNSVDLVLTDPPYFEIKGDFDFKWKSFDDYLNWVEILAIEFKRILADNGTLFYWGYSTKIAYSQIVLDKYFNLENSLVWQKPDSIQFQYYSPDLANRFNTHNERLLMYSNEILMTGAEKIHEEYIKPLHTFAKYLRDEFKRAGVTAKEVARLFPSKTGGLTGCVSNWLNGDNVITKEQYLKIREYLNNEYLRKEYEYLRKEYEDLRKEYEDLRRYFYNPNKYEEVLKFSQESNVSGKYDHDTIKPIKLSRALIQTCSRVGSSVYIPFVGSGTECLSCEMEGRQWIGSEINPDYCDIANKRINAERNQTKLNLTS